MLPHLWWCFFLVVLQAAGAESPERSDASQCDWSLWLQQSRHPGHVAGHSEVHGHQCLDSGHSLVAASNSVVKAAVFLIFLSIL